MHFRSATMSPAYVPKDVPKWDGPQQIDKPVSIIIPISSKVYCGVLKDCLESIRTQQHVYQRAIEIVVVYLRRDGEPNGVAEISKVTNEFGADLFSGTHKGDRFPLCLARNSGARQATNNLLAFLDVDIILDPEALAWSLTYSNAVVYVMTSRLGKRPKRGTVATANTKDFRALARKGSILNSGFGGFLLLPQSVFHAVHGYDEVYDIAWGAETTISSTGFCTTGCLVARL